MRQEELDLKLQRGLILKMEKSVDEIQLLDENQLESIVRKKLGETKDIIEVPNLSERTYEYLSKVFPKENYELNGVLTEDAGYVLHIREKQNVCY